MRLSDDFNRRTLCVILHYGSEADTNNCIESLLNEDEIDIVVSDNDPCQSYLPPGELQAHVKTVKTGGTAGFSEGNNIAVRANLTVNHDSVFILNNDTVVNPGAINILRSTLFLDGVGAVGPCMPYASDTEKIWACGGYINKLKLAIGGLQPQFKIPYEVDYLPGAAILCRADIWKKIGGLSEDYFLAYEEAEFALEVRSHGLKVMVDPRAVILHKVGMSSQVKPEYFYNGIRGQLIFAKYLYGPRFGFIYGALVTAASSVRAGIFKEFFNKMRIFAKAIYDEATGEPLDRQALDSIAFRYSRRELGEGPQAGPWTASPRRRRPPTE
jgi:GT2 family glycosyltransferase